MVIDLWTTSGHTSSIEDSLAGTPSVSSRSFRYMRDPVFVVALLLCLITRFSLKPSIDHWFVHEYLNDMLCLPLFLPVILQVQAWLRIRPRDAMPTLLEVLHNGIVFSAVFELLLPRLPMFDSVADPWDAVAYFAGACVAYAIWNFRKWYQ